MWFLTVHTQNTNRQERLIDKNTEAASLGSQNCSKMNPHSFTLCHFDERNIYFIIIGFSLSHQLRVLCNFGKKTWSLMVKHFPSPSPQRPATMNTICLFFFLKSVQYTHIMPHEFWVMESFKFLKKIQLSLAAGWGGESMKLPCALMGKKSLDSVIFSKRTESAALVFLCLRGLVCPRP